MKLARTQEFHFGWLGVISIIDVIFLLIFFLLLSSNFILQPGIAVSLPLSRFTLGPQLNPQIISITGGPAPAVYFRDQKVALDRSRPAARCRQNGRPPCHHQSRSPHALRSRGRGDECRARARHHFRRARDLAPAAMTPRPGTSAAEFTPDLRLERGRRRKVSFFSFSPAPSLLHALCFYLFQIVYPVTVALSPPPARVNLITPTPSKGAFCCAGSRPKIPRSPPPRSAPPTLWPRSRRSQHTFPPICGGSPRSNNSRAMQPDLRIPSAQPPGPVALPQPAAPTPAASVASRVQFAENAGTLGHARVPAARVHRFALMNRPPPRNSASASAHAARCNIVSWKIPLAIARWMNKRAARSCSAGSPRCLADAIPQGSALSGPPRPRSGAATSPSARPTSAHLPRRDPRQPGRAGHDLSAGFSCGSFSPLDSRRVESPTARTPGVALPIAVRDLRFRVRRSNARIASAVPTLRKLERTI